MAPLRPFLELDQVSLQYGGADGTLALDELTMAVQPGEFVAVVGPSGCGKSTLMKLLSGLWPASDGTVIVDGQEVAGPLSIAGMAFQNPTLLPWRSVLRNVLLPLEVVKPHRGRLSRERAAYEAKARDLLALVGLAGFEGKSPWQLSGGMQQRVSLCRALIHDPRLLMLDEPFGALDIFTREELWAVLQDVWLARRPTVVLVTHDLREAVYLADRVFVMSARPGRMVHVQPIGLPRPRSLATTYLPEFTELVHGLRDRISDVRSAIIGRTTSRSTARSAARPIRSPRSGSPSYARNLRQRNHTHRHRGHSRRRFALSTVSLMPWPMAPIGRSPSSCVTRG